MLVLFFYLFSFQQPTDSLDIDYRTLIDIELHSARNNHRGTFNLDEKDLYIYNIGTGILHKKNNAGTTTIDTC